MNWLTSLPRRLRAFRFRDISIRHVECNIVLGNGAYFARTYIFENPDRSSPLSAIYVRCDSDPNFEIEVIERPERGAELRQRIANSGVWFGVYTGSYPEEVEGLSKLDIPDPKCAYLISDSPPRYDNYKGSLKDSTIYEKSAESMLKFLKVIGSTDLVSCDPEIRTAMLNAMRTVLTAASHPSIDMGRHFLAGQSQGHRSSGKANVLTL